MLVDYVVGSFQIYLLYFASGPTMCAQPSNVQYLLITRVSSKLYIEIQYDDTQVGWILSYGVLHMPLFMVQFNHKTVLYMKPQ